MSTSDAVVRHKAMLNLVLAGIILIGAFLRMAGLQQIPPGLYHDEAVEGVDALRILHGEFPIYFESNNGREPAFMYALAAGIAVAGWSPFTLRLVSALAGIVAVPITYLALRELFDRRVGLLAALIYAGTFWPVEVSRLALRSSLLPAALGLGLWGLMRAWRRDRWRDWLLGGGLYALSLYTYLPARLALLVPILIGGISLALGRDRRKLIRGGAIFAVAYGLTAMPLAAYALGHWEIVMGRPGQVSVFNSITSPAQFIQVALSQSVSVFSMFLVSGDTNWRHNIPGRPVFDWLMGLAFVVGLAVVAWRWRERRVQWAWAWLAVFLAPTLLADSAPHYLRAYGLWPVLAAIPALGLLAIFSFLRSRAGGVVSGVLAAALLGGSLLVTARDYFWRDYLTSPNAYYAFDSAAVQLAVDVNAFTGQGWAGYGLHDTATGELWIEPRLYKFLNTIPVMIPLQPDANGPLHFLEPNSSAGPLAAPRVRLIFVPGEEATYMPMLPRHSLISLRDGSYANDTAEIHPYLFYRFLTAVPASGLPAPVACFEPGVRLLSPHISQAPNGLEVELSWQAVTSGLPYDTVFLHAYQGDNIVAQLDSYPAKGLIPFGWLRPDDVIEETRTLPVRVGTSDAEASRLGVGLYDLTTGRRRTVTDCSGNSLGDEVFVPLRP